MDATAELGRDAKSKHQVQPEYGDEQADAGLPNPSREIMFSGAKGDREIIIFPVQLTTSAIGNLTRLILTLDLCDGPYNSGVPHYIEKRQVQTL